MKSNRSKVIFLLASISQPRCIKRIQSFIKGGYEVEIYGFDRGYYNINACIEGVTINNLGEVQSGKDYLHKFINSKKLLDNLFQKELGDEVIYYAFSFDLALICRLRGKRYIYEISDLIYSYFKFNALRRIFMIVDKWIIKNSILSVLTSEGFKQYLKLDRYTNVILQPNRVNSSIPKSNNNDFFNIEKIRFAYVGAFRYPNTIFRFAQVIGERYPQHEFNFYGDSMLTPLAIELSKKYKNIIYNGPFKNPDDLRFIYENIDILVACYDTKTINERIAEPNKLYEALFFKKPIIVSEMTFLAKKVENWGCGFILNATEDKNIINLLNSIDLPIIQKLKENINSIPLKEIVDDDASHILAYLSSKHFKKESE